MPDEPLALGSSQSCCAGQDFVNRPASLLEGLHRKVDKIDAGHAERADLRDAKVRLEQIVAEGLLKFLGRNGAPENPQAVGDVLYGVKADDNRDYPAILGQVMEALKTQNPKSWSAVRDELVEMIKEEPA